MSHQVRTQSLLPSVRPSGRCMSRGHSVQEASSSPLWPALPCPTLPTFYPIYPTPPYRTLPYSTPPPTLLHHLPYLYPTLPNIYPIPHPTFALPYPTSTLSGPTLPAPVQPYPTLILSGSNYPNPTIPCSRSCHAALLSMISLLSIGSGSTRSLSTFTGDQQHDIDRYIQLTFQRHRCSVPAPNASSARSTPASTEISTSRPIHTIFSCAPLTLQHAT